MSRADSPEEDPSLNCQWWTLIDVFHCAICASAHHIVYVLHDSKSDSSVCSSIAHTLTCICEILRSSSQWETTCWEQAQQANQPAYEPVISRALLSALYVLARPIPYRLQAVWSFCRVERSENIQNFFESRLSQHKYPRPASPTILFPNSNFCLTQRCASRPSKPPRSYS